MTSMPSTGMVPRRGASGGRGHVHTLHAGSQVGPCGSEKWVPETALLGHLGSWCPGQTTRLSPRLPSSQGMPITCFCLFV